ncbi:MAG: hypothetical protein LBK27_02085 [Treponema sp.]|jgi:hypothetical protein|nr:hypothetical protein [Treponema sp.]
MRKAIRKTGLVLRAAVILLFAGACGIEDYAFLYPVSEGRISPNAHSANIDLPAVEIVEAQYFTNYVIYYRIYISNMLENGVITTPEQMSQINPALASDYTNLYYYTSNNPSSTETIYSSMALFGNRRYYALALEGNNINLVLNSLSPQRLTLEFAGPPPFMQLGSGAPINLWRSTNNGAFTPSPDRRFVNTPDLYASANATVDINADVADKTGSSNLYTYVSLYIAKMGRDIRTLTPIYSAPTFIGIFKLPE